MNASVYKWHKLAKFIEDALAEAIHNIESEVGYTAGLASLSLEYYVETVRLWRYTEANYLISSRSVAGVSVPAILEARRADLLRIAPVLGVNPDAIACEECGGETYQGGTCRRCGHTNGSKK